MAVGLSFPTTIHAVNGVRLATAAAGIRYSDRDDLVLLEICEGASVAGVFTRNMFRAAPVLVAVSNLAAITPRFLLVNSGNANAGTGEEGYSNCVATTRLVAEAAGCDAQQVLPFSTGVIGEPLPVAPFREAVPRAMQALSADNWLAAARAIMTTDTVPKVVSRQFNIDGKSVTLTGMAKGAGMIRPDMATMLAFIATDADIDNSLLQRMLSEAVDQSFHRITVDGDTSTNDACILIATGRGELELSDAKQQTVAAMQAAITDMCMELAQAVIRDAEGITKFITINVEQGTSEAECLQVAYTVAHSPLVKTAFFASDPNWGRILAAVGRAGLSALDVSTVSIYLGDVCIVSQGGRAQDYTEQQGQRVMQQDEITMTIRLARGDAHATVWTSDLSHDYVRINAEYRT
jgi:glutamate N-acetyltransferase/amino-acid N-acetyltransferase